MQIEEAVENIRNRNMGTIGDSIRLLAETPGEEASKAVFELLLHSNNLGLKKRLLGALGEKREYYRVWLVSELDENVQEDAKKLLSEMRPKEGDFARFWKKSMEKTKEEGENKELMEEKTALAKAARLMVGKMRAPAEEWGEILREAMESNDFERGKEAINEMTVDGSFEIRKLLKGVAERGPIRLKIAALEALVEAGDERIVDDIIKLANSSDEKCALAGLGLIGKAGAKFRQVRCFNHVRDSAAKNFYPDIREKTVVILGRWIKNYFMTNECTELLVKFLSMDRNENVRLQAIWPLAELEARVLPLFEERIFEDESQDVADELVEAIKSLKGPVARQSLLRVLSKLALLGIRKEKVDGKRFKRIVDDIGGMGTEEARGVLEDLAKSKDVDPTLRRMVKVALYEMEKDSDQPIRRSKFPTDPGSLALDMGKKGGIHERITLSPGGRGDLAKAELKRTKPK